MTPVIISDYINFEDNKGPLHIGRVKTKPLSPGTYHLVYVANHTICIYPYKSNKNKINSIYENYEEVKKILFY